jgi:hypothetical protein
MNTPVSVPKPAARRRCAPAARRRHPCQLGNMGFPTVARGLLLATLAVGLALAGAAPAFAHAERPASTTTLEAGPYLLVVALYAEQPRAGEELPVAVTPGLGAAAPSQVRVVARPGLGTNATPIRAELAPDPDDPGSYAGSVRLSVTGAWLLEVVAAGPAGDGRALVPVTAAAPGAVPVWLGWLVGLAPLLGVVWFGWWQHRYLRRLEALPAA